MAHPLTPPSGEGEAARTDEGDRLNVDWTAIEGEPEFQELVRARRAFVIPGTIFFLTWYMGFIVLTAVAPGFMGERVYQGLTVGYVLALTQFLMVLVLGIWYLRKSAQVFDPLAERAIARYAEEHPDAVAAEKAAARPEQEQPAAESVPSNRETVR
jgi:uncharacterized membrane protein (DUF485 family)